MPFGVVFAALFFGVLCPWYGLSVSSDGGAAAWLAAAVWAIAGFAVAGGLLTRRKWSRAIAVAACAPAVLEGARQVILRGDLLEVLLLLAGLTTGVLLLVPATGVRPGDRLASATGNAGRRPIALMALGGAAGLAILVAWNLASRATPAPASDAASELRRPARGAFDAARTHAGALPASSGAGESGAIAWTSFTGGLANAKSRNTPMFVQFYATWCGACRTMDRSTLRDGAVIRKLQEMVAVRVNAEEQAPRDGLKGVDLANRFRVEAYPTLLVLDPTGRELARLVGAPDPPTFLRWLDDAMTGSSGAHPGDRDRTVRAANH